VLTSAVNLIKAEKDIRSEVKGDFHLKTTRNGVRVVTREMADYVAIKRHFDLNQLSYFTFHPKCEKPIKAVIRHLRSDTPAEDISQELTALGFNVTSVRQMTVSRSLPQGGSQAVHIPLFLVTLTRNKKSHEIFKLTSLSQIMINVEAYRARTGLTQCYNCQQFGHAWANCKQPPRCLWCGGGHLHKECPEKTNDNSTPNYCNCKLGPEEKPHPSNYRGCKLAKEMLRRKLQKTPARPATGRVFQLRYTTPELSFAAALGISSRQQQQTAPHPAPQSHPLPAGRSGVLPSTQQQQSVKETGQSVQESSPLLSDMFKVATLVQQIMRELNGAVSEEDKIVAITKIVLQLMKHDGH
jgi:hypothetical protein